MNKLIYQLKSIISYFKWNLLSQKYLFNNNELRKFQIEKINYQLRNAFENNPFYKDYYFKNGLSSNFQITTLDDISKVPVLRKKDFKIAASQKTIISINYNLSELISHHTTGSTGNPTEVFTYHKLDKIRGRVMQRIWFSSGKITYKKILKVWRSKLPTLDEKRRIQYGLLKNYEILDYERIKFHKENSDNINSIYSFNPRIIRGYVSALYDLGKKVENKKIKSLEVVIASAEYLSSIVWNKLEKMFKVPVINLYGGTEAPAIAQSTKTSRNMYINEDLYFVELLDKNYQNAKPGDVSKIVITDLHNEAFPLIRYEIGDLAIADNSFFNLDHNIRYFLSVEGRSNDIFIFEDGSILYSHFWHIIFRAENWIDSFQVIQTTPQKIVINLKPLDENNLSNLENLKFRINEKLPMVEIEYFIVQNIPLGPGGKELAIFSMISTDFNNSN